MKRVLALAAALLLVCSPLCLADGFRHPASEIEEFALASPVPTTLFSADLTRAVVATRECRQVPLAELAASEVRIAGLRIDPRTFSETRENYYNDIQLLDVATGKMRTVAGLPAEPRIKFLTWSPGGRYLCFTQNEDNRVELWRVDADSPAPAAERMTTFCVNTIFGTPFVFLDEDHVLFKAVPQTDRKEPVWSLPTSSVVQEVKGEKKSIRTYQDLMKSPADEEMYDYCCASILTVLGPEGARKVGEPAIYRSYNVSPDGNYAIVVTEHRPYSYVEAHNSFPSKQFIISLQDGQVVRMLRDGTKKKEPKTDEPKDGPKKGEPKKPVPAGFNWRPDLPATLYWSEVEGGGAPFGPGGPMGPPPADVPAPKDSANAKDKPEKTFTDKVFQCTAPFDFENDRQLVLNPEYRLGRITWCDGSLALYEETSSKQKVRRMVAAVPCDTAKPRRVLYTLSTEVDTVGDFPAYGRPYTVRNAYGRNVAWTDAKHSYIYMQGNDRRDAEGFRREFLDKVVLKDGGRTPVWMASGERKETFSGISDYKRPRIIVRREAYGVVPDYWEVDLRKRNDRRITAFKDPVARFSELVTDQYVTYTREDGLKCYAHLYLPAGYDPERDGRLPVFMWTYPYDYKCAAECDKARPEKDKYTKPTYGSAMLWATQGYAVLDEFTMAIIAADKDSLANDRFLDQLVMSAEAAVDFVCDSIGVGDRERIGVGGHSYGAFMTANLLAHTRLFRAGVARSGAYNRSLTPFGFQSERRNYWKARQVYDEMSPFNYADRIKDALLIIHGQMDNNTGTFPVQSERLYQALVYFGGTARYVQLPYESHSYQAVETTLDMLYETGAWLDKYVKNAKPREKSREKAEKQEEDSKN